MRNHHLGKRLAAVTLASGIVTGCVGIVRKAHTQEAQNPSTLVALALPSQPPKGAIVLYNGKAEQLSEYWTERYNGAAVQWKRSDDGVLTPNGKDITTKQEYGDSYVHVEYRIPVDASGKTLGHGNSGVGLQGRYEIQIMDSYGQKPEAHSNASLYSQIPAQVNASKKPGEWQTFDIIFRAPRFGDNGQVSEKPRATVFHNGVLVQNNAEFTGMTGIQYGQYKEMTKTGPLVIQGDHDPVQYRNLWIVPM